MSRIVYRVLVEGRDELPFFQVLAITVRGERDLDASVMEARLSSWMLERGEQFICLDPSETGPLDDEHVPEPIRAATAEIAPVSGRIFHPGEEKSLWRRLVRWWS